MTKTIPSLKRRLIGLCYPQLAYLPETERSLALERARAIPFDFVELAGMGAALVLVTTVTSYAVDGLSVGMRLARGVANMVVAVPLVALTVGPFLWRRTRRGLAAELEKYRAGRVAPEANPN